MKVLKNVDPFSLNTIELEKEVTKLKSLEHENLVKFFILLIFDSVQHSEKQVYILTEYFEVDFGFLIKNLF